MDSSAFDIFDGGDPEPAALLRASIGRYERLAPHTSFDGAFAILPHEMLHEILCALPSRNLARIDCTSKWLAGPVRAAAQAISRRIGLLSIPERRLGESWPCVARRAELKAASRRQQRLSTGDGFAAWLSPSGAIQLARAPSAASSESSTSHLVTPIVLWKPCPPLPRAQARAVSCGSEHALLLLDDFSVILIDYSIDFPNPKWRVLIEALSDAAEHVVAVECGAMHSLLVGSQGSLWSYGDE